MTAGTAFKEACTKHGVKKVNAKVLGDLSAVELADLVTLDLGGTYVGNRGLMAVLDVVEQAPLFHTLDFSKQKIYNTDPLPDSVKGNTMLERLIELAKTHPSLSSIDLSGNPLSNLVARKLLGLATENGRIKTISLEDTPVDADLLQLINKKTEANRGDGDDAFAFGGVQPPEDDDGGFGAKPMTMAPAPPEGGGLSAPRGVARRKTVSSSSYDPDAAKQFVPPKYPKSDADRKIILDLLKDNLLFSHLDDDAISTCIDAMQQRLFQFLDEPLMEGDEGNSLYIIAQGKCDILKQGEKVAEKPEKSAFGELELMYDTPCVATVRVATDSCEVWTLDRETYKHIVVGASIRKRMQYESILTTVPFLQALAPYERMQIADALSSDYHDPGTRIIRHNDEGEWMFLIVEGTVEVIGRDQDGKEVKVCEMGPGENFGELEFFNNHRCVADVIAVSRVKTAKINRKHFEMCLGPVLHILKRNTGLPKYDYYRSLLERDGQRS
eukprot:TRINITY_DN1674_c8_g7_i1.p1 TRINITY_DN1674_c8_g7~~TRINITY_DN1674_c8_g7_i1.p1  ORF type:complete len:530 (+),score=211.07 TRINITY_DN1674_c8_g7_i1:100-1590(+)